MLFAKPVFIYALGYNSSQGQYCHKQINIERDEFKVVLKRIDQPLTILAWWIVDALKI